MLLKFGSLNSTYLNYFENNDMDFKYLGQDGDFYKLQFKNKSLENYIIFYLNKNNGIVEKIEENFGGVKNTYEISVEFDCVNSDDVKYPDLTEYEIGVSSSTVVPEVEENYKQEKAENNTNLNSTK